MLEIDEVYGFHFLGRQDFQCPLDTVALMPENLMLLLKLLAALYRYSSLLYCLLGRRQLACSATYSTIADSLRRDLAQHSPLSSKLKF